MNRKSAVLTLSIGIGQRVRIAVRAGSRPRRDLLGPAHRREGRVGLRRMRGRAARLRRLRAGPQPTPQQIIEQATSAMRPSTGKRDCAPSSVLRARALAALALYAFEQISTAGVLTIIAVEVVASDRLFRADRPHAADHVALAQDPALLSS